MSRSDPQALIEASKIRNSVGQTQTQATLGKPETAVLEIILDVPCSAAALIDACGIVAGQTGDPSEVAIEVIGKYDANYLEDRPKALRISRNITAFVGNSDPDMPI